MPLPRSIRINSVSAWSSRVCAVRTVRGAARPRGLSPAADSARRGLRPAGRCFGLAPVQRSVRWGTSSVLARRLTSRASRAAFRPQAVVDGDGDQSRPARKRAAPAGGKPHQGKGIGTAGHRQHERGRGLPMGEQVLRLLYRDRRLVRIGHGSAGAMRAPMFGAIGR
jgi:hypothetical protein